MESSRLAKVVSILCIFMMPLGQVGIDIYTPSMPAMVAVFGTSAGGIQLTVTLYTIGLGLALLLTGPIIDRFGRYRILLLGMALYIIAAILTIFMPTLSLLLLMRVLQGLGAGIVITTARACISDCFEGEPLARVVANMAFVWSFTPILAPFIGGYLQHYIGWQANFIFMGVYCTLVMLLTVWLLAETMPHELRQPIRVSTILRNYKRIVITRAFIGNITQMTCAYSYIIFFNVTAPFMLQTELGLTAVHYGQALLIVGGSYAVGTVVNKRLIRAYPRERLIPIGSKLSVLFCLIQLILGWLGYFSLFVVLLPAIAVFFLVGLIYANALTNGMALFRDIAGSVSSLLGFIPMVGCAAATVIATHVRHTDVIAFALLSLCGYGIATGVYWWSQRHKISPPPSVI